MAALNLHLIASVFGILGTVVSFLVYLAPIPTFYWIYKKKSTKKFPFLPYSMALASAMLTLYYAYVKKDGFMLVAINSLGCLIETGYLIMFLIYAPPKSRIFTGKFIVLFNIVGYGVILLCTTLIPNLPLRLKLVGWINIVFNVCVFAAPLSNMRHVIKTKSVEYMSFSLSLSLTLCAVMWFFYGLLIRDLYIAAPNVLGFLFGIAQMILFMVFRKNTKKAVVLLPEYSLKNLVPSTNRIAAPANDDKTVSVVINTQIQVRAEDTEKSSKTNDHKNQPEQRPPNDKVTNAALGVILRRGSI